MSDTIQASGTDIVGFSLQNTATGSSGAQYLQFNQQFAEGAVPAGTLLTAVIGTRTVAVQMDVSSRYADGSVRSAVLTLAAPSVAAGATVTGTLLADTASPAPAIATTAALDTGYDLAVNLDIAGIGAVTIDAAGALRNAAANSSLEIIRQGALATEIRFDVPVGRALHLTFDVVTYADGSTSTTVGFRNDIAMGTEGGTIQYNSISVVQGGAVQFSRAGLTQYQYQTWSQAIYDGATAKPTLHVRHDVDYLERIGVLLSYDLSAKLGTLPSVPSSWTNVLGVNGVTQYMPTTGGRDDIGPTTEANATWIITQDPNAAKYALAQDQAAGTIPWHLYDASKGHYLSIGDYPQVWVDPRGAVQPAQLPGSAGGWTTDREHAPDVSFAAWLLTGDSYHLDMLNAQAFWVLSSAWPGPRQDARGIVINDDQNVRAQAWSLRVLQEAAFANPDGSYEKAFFTGVIDRNWKSLLARIPTLTAQQGELAGIIPEPGGADYLPWRQEFFASTTAQGALMGNADARAILKWQANFLSGRFLTPDMSPYNGYAYAITVKSSSESAWLNTWADATAASRASGQYISSHNPGYYLPLAAMSNANLITVFSGGNDPTDHKVAADAMRAYGWLVSTGQPDLTAYAQFRVTPRMGDGSQIGWEEIRIVAPTALNTAFTFTGDNVFAYDRGIGRTTLNGTAGADVLIDNSTGGGDRLAGRGGDDYLIGGTGTNVFAPGDGQDYALVRGGAAIFEVSAASPGQLEIQGFRIGTDIIALTGQISLALILASVRSDGFGGTLLTISLERTIRLNGIVPSLITGIMFDLSDAQPIGTIFGTLGDDTMAGTADADTMAGLTGNDEYIVNNSGDVVTELLAGGIDHVTASINYTLSANVENLTLVGAGNINGTGNTLANILVGNAGNNILDGNGGADTMRGGAGNDTYYVDNAGDVVTEAAGQGTDTVQSTISYTLLAEVERLTLAGSGNINGTGNALANLLTGNAGNNILDGKGGADTMRGGAGNDTYYVDNAGDVVTEAAGQGTDTVQSTISYTLSANVENLALIGAGNVNGTGNTLANLLTGNAGNNILTGGSGADTMSGGAGNDTYYVDTRGDVVSESIGGGTDTVISSVRFSLVDKEIERLTLTGSADIYGTGNSYANVLIGNDGDNILNGGGGADTMTGGAGSDTFKFTSKLVAGNIDTITDFNVAADTIALNRVSFSAIGGTGTLSASQFVANASGTAQDANDRIIYETDTGKLFYDSNGSAAGGRTQFATLDPGLALTNADFSIF